MRSLRKCLPILSSSRSSKKRRNGLEETIVILKYLCARLGTQLPAKLKDLRSFIINISVGETRKERAMLDLRALINLMPYGLYTELGLKELKPSSMELLLADQLVRHPRGVVEDVLVQVGKLIILADFVILDMEEGTSKDKEMPIFLGQPFMATVKAIIDVHNGTLTMTVLGEIVEFKMAESMKHPARALNLFNV